MLRSVSDAEVKIWISKGSVGRTSKGGVGGGDGSTVRWTRDIRDRDNVCRLGEEGETVGGSRDGGRVGKRVWRLGKAERRKRSLTSIGRMRRIEVNGLGGVNFERPASRRRVMRMGGSDGRESPANGVGLGHWNAGGVVLGARATAARVPRLGGVPLMEGQWNGRLRRAHADCEGFLLGSFRTSFELSETSEILSLMNE
jgi:hypothetical protein